MKIIRVVIKDRFVGYPNELYFDFFENEEWLNFVEQILRTSKYDVEIIQSNEGEKNVKI